MKQIIDLLYISRNPRIVFSKLRSLRSSNTLVALSARHLFWNPILGLREVYIVRKLLLKLVCVRILLVFLFIPMISSPSFAVRESRPTPTDHRLRVMVYHPDDVFKFIGYYGYQGSIEFSKSEEIISISMGDTTAWQIVPTGNRIFMKPMEKDATTNMTLITNKRTYYFELYADETTDMRTPEMVFNVRFIYPDDDDTNGAGGGVTNYNHSNTGMPDLEHPEKYNFYYSMSGSEEVAPLKIFDDGEFTYLQFRDKNAELPAIFAVDDDLRESMVNYRLATNDPGLVILEQVFKKLSIRHGKKIACVFNEAFNPN